MNLNEQCLVERLRVRATIRRYATNRPSLEKGKSDQIADLLDEAADAIETLACNTKDNRDKT